MNAILFSSYSNTVAQKTCRSLFAMLVWWHETVNRD